MFDAAFFLFVYWMANEKNLCSFVMIIFKCYTAQQIWEWPSIFVTTYLEAPSWSHRHDDVKRWWAECDFGWLMMHICTCLEWRLPFYLFFSQIEVNKVVWRRSPDVYKNEGSKNNSSHRRHQHRLNSHNFMVAHHYTLSWHRFLFHFLSLSTQTMACNCNCKTFSTIKKKYCQIDRNLWRE